MCRENCEPEDDRNFETSPNSSGVPGSWYAVLLEVAVAMMLVRRTTHGFAPGLRRDMTDSPGLYVVLLSR